MIYLSLFWEFLKVGMFAFGGAYGAIPLIQGSVVGNGWMSEEMFTNVIAISEATPGPIMVNAATYIGSQQAGILGALVATLGVVLPSFVIILLISAFLYKWIKHKSVQSALRGIKPCIMGMILATGCCMALSTFVADTQVDFKGLLISIVLIMAIALYRRARKKEVSPIALIVIAAAFGIALY